MFLCRHSEILRILAFNGLQLKNTKKEKKTNQTLPIFYTVFFWSRLLGPFSKVVSSSGMYETKMGSVAIQAVTGDITKETTDVIVNSSNEKFSLKSGKQFLHGLNPKLHCILVLLCF